MASIRALPACRPTAWPASPSIATTCAPTAATSGSRWRLSTPATPSSGASSRGSQRREGRAGAYQPQGPGAAQPIAARGEVTPVEFLGPEVLALRKPERLELGGQLCGTVEAQPRLAGRRQLQQPRAVPEPCDRAHICRRRGVVEHHGAAWWQAGDEVQRVADRGAAQVHADTEPGEAGRRVAPEGRRVQLRGE